MKIIHVFSKQKFVYITTSLQAYGKKPQANVHKFLLKLRPVSRTAQKAEVYQKLSYECKGPYTKAKQINLLSFSTNISENSYTKLTKCCNWTNRRLQFCQDVLTCTPHQPGSVIVSGKSLHLPQPMMPV